MKLEILVSEFLKYCEDCLLSVNTLRAYRIDLKAFLTYAKASGVENIEQVNKDFLKAYFHTLYLNEKKGTAYRKGAVVKTFMSYVRNKEYIAAGVYERSDYILAREEKKNINTISTETISKLMNNLASEYQEAKSDYARMVAFRNIIIIDLLCYSGIRISELCNLKASNISFFQDFYCVNIEGFRERTIHINNKEARDNLKFYCDFYSLEIKEAGYLLFNRNNEQLSEQTVRRMLKKKSNEIGLADEITPKVLRYTLAENMVKSKIETIQLQKFLGDKVIATTRQYFKDRDLKNMNIINPEDIYRM